MEWENMFTLRLTAAKSTIYNEKCFNQQWIPTNFIHNLPKFLKDFQNSREVFSNIPLIFFWNTHLLKINEFSSEFWNSGQTFTYIIRGKQQRNFIENLE